MLIFQAREIKSIKVIRKQQQQPFRAIRLSISLIINKLSTTDIDYRSIENKTYTIYQN